MFNSESLETRQHDIIVTETGKRTKQLTIDSVDARHAGEYTCIASNIAGSVSRTAVLAVNGILPNLCAKHIFQIYRVDLSKF